MLDLFFLFVLAAIVIVGIVLLLRWVLPQLGLGTFETPVKIVLGVVIALIVVYFVWRLVQSVPMP